MSKSGSDQNSTPVSSRPRVWFLFSPAGPKPAPGAISAQMAREKLAWLDSEMTGREFVCGPRFTLADIHFYVFVDFFETLGLNYPRELGWIDSHYKRVGERPTAQA